MVAVACSDSQVIFKHANARSMSMTYNGHVEPHLLAGRLSEAETSPLAIATVNHPAAMLINILFVR